MSESDADGAEEAWAREQRSRVEEYLRRERVDHLGVGDHPAFCVPPYVATLGGPVKEAARLGRIVGHQR